MKEIDHTDSHQGPYDGQNTSGGGANPNILNFAGLIPLLRHLQESFKSYLPIAIVLGYVCIATFGEANLFEYVAIIVLAFAVYEVLLYKYLILGFIQRITQPRKALLNTSQDVNSSYFHYDLQNTFYFVTLFIFWWYAFTVLMQVGYAEEFGVPGFLVPYSPNDALRLSEWLIEENLKFIVNNVSKTILPITIFILPIVVFVVLDWRKLLYLFILTLASLGLLFANEYGSIAARSQTSYFVASQNCTSKYPALSNFVSPFYFDNHFVFIKRNEKELVRGEFMIIPVSDINCVLKKIKLE